MPEQLGTIVDDTGSGKPDPNSANGSVSRNQSGAFEPEIIAGYETEQPSTERIASGNGEPRRTKSGRIDGRTLRGSRGRNAGRGNDTEAASQESVHLSRVSIEDLLYSVHLMGAEILKTPEIELDHDEAKKLGNAIQDVAKFYNATFDPKKVAMFQLAIVAGGIYGMRIIAYRNRVKVPKPTLVSKPQPQQKQEPLKANGKTVDFTTISPSDVFGHQDATI